MRFLAIGAMYGLVLAPDLFSQVNTQVMHRYDAERGLYHNLTFNVGLLNGNSDVLNLRTAWRTDFVTEAYYVFGVASYQRGTSGGDFFANRGFLHLRALKTVSPRLEIEIFGQKEFNKLIRLTDRNLVGGGARLRVGRRDSTRASYVEAHVGTGFMYETETHHLTSTSRTRLMRSTNYLTLRMSWDERTSGFSTTYYQVAVSRPSDFRILSESSLLFKVSRWLALSFNFNLRYDHEPPPDVKRHDIEVLNGIVIAW